MGSRCEGLLPAVLTGTRHNCPGVAAVPREYPVDHAQRLAAFHVTSLSGFRFVRGILQPLQRSLQLRLVCRREPTDVGVLERPLTRPRHDFTDLSLRYTREPSREGQDIVPQLVELRSRSVTVRARDSQPSKLRPGPVPVAELQTKLRCPVRRAPVRFRRLTVAGLVGTVAIPW